MIEQLNLFTSQDKRLAAREELVTKLLYLMFDYKYVAYLIENSLIDHKAFDYCIEVLSTITHVAYHLGYSTNKYSRWSRDYWASRAAYDPIYSPVEPRSISDLVRIASDYEVSSKRLIMRIKAILDPGDLLVRENLDDLEEKILKISRSLRNPT